MVWFELEVTEVLFGEDVGDGVAGDVCGGGLDRVEGKLGYRLCR